MEIDLFNIKKVTNSDTFSRDGAYLNYGYKSEKVRKNHDDNDNLPTYAGKLF